MIMFARRENKMERIAKFLSGVFYIATEDGGQPRVRPFDSGTEYEGKIYFGTANNKKVYAQLMANPKIEIFAMNDEGTMRLTGEVMLEKDAARTTEVFRKMGKYRDNDANPVLAAFYVAGGKAVVTGREGESEVVEI